MRNPHPSKLPFMVFADDEGNVREDIHYYMVGGSSREARKLAPQDLIELPEGSEFFFLPGRKPYGFSKKNNAIELYPHGRAVAAFVSPAYSQTYLSAYEKIAQAPVLPLYAYTAVGWLDGKFYTTAVRI